MKLGPSYVLLNRIETTRLIIDVCIVYKEVFTKRYLHPEARDDLLLSGRKIPCAPVKVLRPLSTIEQDKTRIYLGKQLSRQ